MDRFTEQLISSARCDRDEDGRPEPPATAAGYTCQNCGEAVEGTTWQDEFDYWACDDCYAEALSVLAREAKEALQIYQQRVPVIPMQGELFPRRAPVVALFESVSDLMLDEGVA